MSFLTRIKYDNLVLFGTSIFLFLGSLFYLKKIPKQLDWTMPFLGTLDYGLSLLTLLFVFKFHKNGVSKVKFNISSYYIKFIKDNYSIYYFIIIYLLYKAFIAGGHLFRGASRDQMIGDFNSGLLVVILAPLITTGFSFCLMFKLPKKYFLLTFLGLLSLMTISASRSELMFIVFFSITLFYFKQDTKVAKSKILIRLFLYVMCFVFIGAFITVFLQKRASQNDWFLVIELIIETLFKYRSFSYYLAEVAIESSNSIEKLFYPFFGYLYEKPLSFVQTPSIPIDSKFILRFFNLGTGNIDYRRQILANVLYPWWSWFYGVFGVLGLLIKSLYIYFLAFLCLSKKLHLTFVYLVCVILFTSVARHPFLTTENIFFILIVIYSDYKFKKYKKKIVRYES